MIRLTVQTGEEIETLVYPIHRAGRLTEWFDEDDVNHVLWPFQLRTDVLDSSLCCHHQNPIREIIF